MLQRRAARILYGVALAGSLLGSSAGCGARAEEPGGAVDSERGGGRSGNESAPSTGAAAVGTRIAAGPSTPQVPEQPPNSGSLSPGELPMGMGAEPIGFSPICFINQELVCEALGSSVAMGCRCQRIIPRTASDCALAAQFICGDAGTADAGTECYCDDGLGCPAWQRPGCESYGPQRGCGCFTLYTR